MGLLNNKVALVTGGATGIGAAIATALHEAECNVAYTYFRSSPDSLAADSDSVIGLHGDLTDEGAVTHIIDNTLERFGGLDILVNNAGDLIARRSLQEMDHAFFKKVMAVNVDSMMLVTKHALPHLSGSSDGASIINMASLAGRKGGHNGSLAYATSKGAVLTFTRALAAEVAQEGIRVNAIAPGLILGTKFHNTHTTEESAQTTVEEQIPLGRAGTPQDVAQAALYLAQQYDGFTTGATLDVNGGQYMM